MPWWGWALLAWGPVALAGGVLVGRVVRESHRRDRPVSYVLEGNEVRDPLDE